MSSDWEKRFTGIDEKTKKLMLQELKEAVTVSDKSLLTENEIYELLTLLPRDYFKKLRRLNLKQTRKDAVEFKEKIEDLLLAEEKLYEFWVKVMSGVSPEERREAPNTFTILRLIHPALWYRVYKKIAAQNELWTAEMVGFIDDRPFLIP